MRNIVLVIMLAVLSASTASAQQSRDLKPGKPAATIPLRAPKTAANSCAEYGAGFVKVEGTSTCMKIGGSIGVGVGTSR
jgi:hypothetical protein